MAPKMKRLAWSKRNEDMRWQTRSWNPQLLEMEDRTVQGESLEALRAEVRQRVDTLRAKYEKDRAEEAPYLFTQDRWGHRYMDYGAVRAATARIEKAERLLKCMESDGWGPTHTILYDEEAKEFDMDSVEEWSNATSVVREALNLDREYHYLVRRSGSYVEGLDTLDKTLDLLLGLKWTEHAWDTLPEGAGRPVARYFRATLPDGVAGFRNAINVAEARDRGLSLEMRVQEEKVNPSCTLNPRALGVFSLDGTDPTPTREVWIIIGPDGEGGSAVWTWHPGAPAAPVTKRHYSALEEGRWDAPELQDVSVHLPH